MQIPTIRLNSGVEMPIIGLGTWQLTGEDCESSIRQALETGYSHIDTSDDYENEEVVGRAIKDFDRSKIFLTTKVDDSMLRKDDVVKACKDSLERLDVDYIDLYLIHRPNPSVPIKETMEGMKSLVDDGMVRSIGISNFSVDGARSAIEASEIPVAVNQVKIHPYHYQPDLIRDLKENGLEVSAYSPLDTGQIVDDDVLTEIGKKYGKSAPQVSIKWLLDKGLIVITKMSSKEHLKENIDMFDWKLSEEDTKRIDDLAQKSMRG